ncbi:hypothetical protein DIPPA_35861 [Diplonema papillatum]|nr:hypothetical protein DIPPA_35861 [Diplonema papillatum]
MRWWLTPAFSCLFRQDETASERNRKTVLVLLAVFVLVVSAAATGLSAWGVASSATGPWAYVSFFLLFVSASTLARVAATRRASSRLVWLFALALLAGVGFIDFMQAKNALPRAWPLFAVVQLFLAACDAPRGGGIVVLLATAWLAVQLVDPVFGVGLYAGSFGRLSSVAVCACTEPPCRNGRAAVAEFLQQVIVLTCAAVFARIQSPAAQRKAELEAAVDKAAHLVDLASQFELEYMAGELAGAEAAFSLPPPLCAALRKLHHTLELCEAMMPQCFIRHASHDTLPVDKPGARDVSKRTPDHASVLVDSFSNHATSGRLSATNTTTQPALISEIPSPVATALAQRSITLVVVNAKKLAEVLQTYPEQFQEVHRTLLSAFQAAVAESKGVIEAFNGDHGVASWNAGRSISKKHEVAALNAAIAFQKHPGPAARGVATNVSVASGTALCGLCGSFGAQEAMIRYNIVGPVYRWAMDLERMGRRWHVDVIADDAVHAEAKGTHLMRLLLEKVEPPPASPAARGGAVAAGALTQPPPPYATLWEVCDDESDSVEWMYMLQRVECYNDLAAAFLAGKPISPEQVHGTLHEGVKPDAHVDHLLKIAESSEPPPVIALVEYPERSFPGRPRKSPSVAFTYNPPQMSSSFERADIPDVSDLVLPFMS